MLHMRSLPCPINHARRTARKVEAGNFRLTKRDLAILERIARHRFLRSDQITSLIKGSEIKIQRRLRFLSRENYLERFVPEQSVKRWGGLS